MRGAVMAGEGAILPRGLIIVPCGPIVPRVMERLAWPMPPWTGTLVTMRPALAPVTSVVRVANRPSRIAVVIEMGARVAGLMAMVGWFATVVTGADGVLKPAGGSTTTGMAFQP